jgi:hypothetical protein
MTAMTELTVKMDLATVEIHAIIAMAKKVNMTTVQFLGI